MVDYRHSDKSTKSPYLRNGLTDHHKILQDDACWFSAPYPQFKSWLLKNTRWRMANLKEDFKSP